MTRRVLVRGAGVAGLATAVELVRGGAAVTIADVAPAIGGGASWMAGGMIAPFCEAAAGEPAVADLGRASADWWQAVLPGHVKRNGTLVVAPPRDRAELRRFAARARECQVVDAAAIGDLEPDLASRFPEALFFAAEAHLDPRAALRALADKLVAEGTQFVVGSEGDAAAFDEVVDCTGFAAMPRLADLRGVRGEMVYLETREVSLRRPVRLLHPRFPVYVVPRGDGRFMVGATMIESADAGLPSVRSVVELLNAAYALHPAFGEARILETSAGVRPSFPDNLPRVVETGGTLHVNGLYRHGFLMAPVVAAEAADRVFSKITGGRDFHETHHQRAIA